ncbi:MAG: DUF2142 domain-containing protein [Clostridiales Family XIII bacterium]|jgi:uncharacterized membrane protein|nr:DUF2142 domain-containing protein [Clostridiales Family XIII bacterium]
MNRFRTLFPKNLPSVLIPLAVFAASLCYIVSEKLPESDFAARMFPWLGAALGAGVLLAIFLALREKISTERMALAMLLFFGAIYLFVFPPNAAPDELVHYSSAYEAADAVMGQKADDPSAIMMRSADTRFYSDYSNFPDMYTYRHFTEELAAAPPKGEAAEIVEANRLTGVPYPYILAPQAAGILLARLLHLNPEWLYLLGRVFNLLAVAVSVWASVKLTPIGKGVFALVAFFPMALELSASLSTDAASICLGFLAAAQYLRIAYSGEPSKLRDLILFAATIALLGPPKVVFFPIFMLAFFLPGKCFATKRLAAVFRVCIALLFIALLFMTLYSYMHRGEDGAPVISLDGVVTYSISGLANDPLHFMRLCKYTIRFFFLFYLLSMAGSDLGWLELSMPGFAVWIFLALPAIAAFRSKSAGDTHSLRPFDRIQFGLVFFLAALGTAVVMYVSWTPEGMQDYILGIQGRYFLPVIPLLILLAARWRRPVRPAWLSDKHLLLVACMLQPLILMTAFSLIAGRTPEGL